MKEGSVEYPRGKELEPKKRFSILNVVIMLAALGLVAFVLFPTDTGARHAAAKSQCLSNLKQLVTSALIYAADNNEQLPLGRGLNSETSGGSLPIYEVLLAPYYKSNLVLRCPEDVVSKKSPVTGKSWFETCGSSYAFRPVLPQLEHFGSAVGAEKAVFIHEVANFHKASTDIPSRNVAFYDGHTKFVSDDKIFGKS